MLDTSFRAERAAFEQEPGVVPITPFSIWGKARQMEANFTQEGGAVNTVECVSKMKPPGSTG